MHATIRRYEGGDGVLSSLRLFATPIVDEKLERALPDPPQITSGGIVTQSNGGVTA